MALISSTFLSLYRRQFRQSRPTEEINPSRSQRNNVAFEISNNSQMSCVLYRVFPLDRAAVCLGRTEMAGMDYTGAPLNVIVFIVVTVLTIFTIQILDLRLK